jgi:hypothetical protein
MYFPCRVDDGIDEEYVRAMLYVDRAARVRTRKENALPFSVHILQAVQAWKRIFPF